jgi:hypothetical protein
MLKNPLYSPYHHNYPSDRYLSICILSMIVMFPDPSDARQRGAENHQQPMQQYYQPYIQPYYQACNPMIPMAMGSSSYPSYSMPYGIQPYGSEVRLADHGHITSIHTHHYTYQY